MYKKSINLISILLIASFSIDTASATTTLKVKHINDVDWTPESDLDYKDKEFNLTASSLMLSGFSSGGFLAVNLFTMFSANIHALGLFASAGPCANRGHFCHNETGEPQQYSTEGFAGTPVFIYSGTMDERVQHREVIETANWLE